MNMNNPLSVQTIGFINLHVLRVAVYRCMETWLMVLVWDGVFNPQDVRLGWRDEITLPGKLN